MCEHNVCVYVENRNFIDFFTENEIYNVVWGNLYDFYCEYMQKKGNFDFSYRDYLNEYCEKNVDTGFEEFDYCPDCGEKLNFEEIKERINNAIYRALCDLPKRKEKNKTKTKIQTDGYVYLVKLDKHYKIGISISPESRLQEFTLLPYPLQDICIENVKNYKQVEKELHKIYAKKRVRGEWFSLDDKDIDYIKRYLKDRKCVKEFE